MRPTSEKKKEGDGDKKNKNKLSHQGFRLQEQVIEALAREAERKGISVSSLVNTILKNYVTQEMQFEELGFI
jgi:predicted HicB family RNase H-like nuclease